MSTCISILVWSVLLEAGIADGIEARAQNLGRDADASSSAASESSVASRSKLFESSTADSPATVSTSNCSIFMHTVLKPSRSQLAQLSEGLSDLAKNAERPPTATKFGASKQHGIEKGKVEVHTPKTTVMVKEVLQEIITVTKFAAIQHKSSGEIRD